ncbi:MAG: nitroreductase [Desulfovibrio sp.]|nr:MAG: nitroreductase [Desulfovibrio sp.]
MSNVTTIIDQDLCTGCGLCIRVCPSQTLAMRDGVACVVGEYSLACGHCQAVCPVNAITVTGIDPAVSDFATFPVVEEWLPHGDYDLARLVQLMRSRRSCRNYLETHVDKALLEDLARIGATAPSGTNSQKWTFTLLPQRRDVEFLALAIADFFRKLNRMAAKGWLRTLLRLVGRPELHEYHREYYPAVCRALQAFERDGEDQLFHHAPSLIVVGSRPGASCPTEDALLASQNILLAAHAMGLGTCLIGYAVAAMQEDCSIQQALGMEKLETVYAVITVGWPDETYQTVTGRKSLLLRSFSAP